MIIGSHRKKTCLRVSNQIRHKPGCTATEDGKSLEISEFRKKGNCTICVAKAKALILGFVFANAKSRFSHDAAQLGPFSIHLIVQLKRTSLKRVKMGVFAGWSVLSTFAKENRFN